MSAIPETPPPGASVGLQVEMQGVDIIADEDRKGQPRDLFSPWFAANVSVLGIPYAAWLLAFNVSFIQALIAGVVGIVFSFLLCGFVAVAGKRGSAPTMILTRAAMGVRGSRLASFLSWILTVGWETVLSSLAVLATATVFETMGWGGGSAVKVVALIVVAVLIVGGGVVGFDLIMKMQKYITIVTAVLTVGYIALTIKEIDMAKVMELPTGNAQAMIGGLVFMLSGFGLGWINMSADYSRYLPRTASSRGVIGWTTLGASIAPLILLTFGLLLLGTHGLGSDMFQSMNASDPIGALTAIIPTWYAIPFLIVALLGLVGGALLDIYSSGLALVSTGLPVPRPVAAGIDGCIMIAGTVYIVFGGSSFFDIFQGFLITLAVPISVWAGIQLADVLLRRRDYDEADLFNPGGRYGSTPLAPLITMIIGTGLGWGLVTNHAAGWLTWQGYLLGPIGGKTGDWAFANIGVLLALVLGFVVTLVASSAKVRWQESLPATSGLTKEDSK